MAKKKKAKTTKKSSKKISSKQLKKVRGGTLKDGAALGQSNPQVLR